MRTTAARFEATGHPFLVYDDLGDPAAPPVLLLHGGAAGSRAAWRDIPERLAAAHRVLAMDMRGHGDSGRASGAYRIDHYASDVEAFIEGVIGRPAALVGHSLGGLVAAQVAGTRPDLVDRAFFEDAPLHWQGEQGIPTRGDRPFRRDAFTERINGMIDAGASAAELSMTAFQEFAETGDFFGPRQTLWAGQRERGATVDEMAEGLRQTLAPLGVLGERFDIDVIKGLISGLLASDPGILTPGRDWLAAYDRTRPMTCLVHMLQGDAAVGPPPIGGVFPDDFVETFLATHPRATVQFVPGAGHAIHVEVPDLFTESLKTFLSDGG